MPNELLGYACCLITSIGWGSMFVPSKRVDTGDGMFSSFVMSLAILFCGLMFQLVYDNGNPFSFEPLAMVGGALWATGNICVPPIIQTIGLSMGLLIWGSVCLITGWAVARFGFIINAQTVAVGWLNTLGVCVCLVALVLYVFVDSDAGTSVETKSINPAPTASLSYVEVHHAVMPTSGQDTPPEVAVALAATEPGLMMSFSPHARKLVALFLCLFSGVCYGTNYLTPQYLIDHGHSPDMPSYTFSHFSGAFVTTFIYFVIYCIYTRNKPWINPACISTSLFAGAVWSIAQISSFYANKNLSMVMAFPVLNACPGLVAALWGIFYFEEIKGTKNLLIVSLAFVITIAGVICIALSN